MESPSEQGQRMRPPEPSRSNGGPMRDVNGQGARSLSGRYDNSDEPTTIFSMEDIGGDEQQAEGPPSALGELEAVDDRDDVFTSSTGSATSSHDGRLGGRFAAAAPGLYVPAAPLPISGSAYHFRAHRAWLSLSAPHSAGFYLGPLPTADGYRGFDLDDDRATASGGAVGGDGGITTQDADDLTFGSRQPLPDLVPRTSETFRRRTYSESSVSVVTVRQFGSELRRMSDVFEHEVLEAKAITSTTVVTTRHQKVISSPLVEGHTTASGDGSPGDEAGRPTIKRRSSGFMQDLKDLLRRNNSPSSL